MKIDMDEVRRLQADRYLNIINDPESDLLLLNYADKAQYNRLAFDEHPLLLDCRGTIVYPDGTVRFKPFRKFFNVAQMPGTSIEELALLGEPVISAKLDGSMCTFIHTLDNPRFATRGSFTSPQAHTATIYWRKYHNLVEDDLDPALTYIFEYTAPSNRVVVAYDREQLRLIGVTETSTGYEYDHHCVISLAKGYGLDYAPLETFQTWQQDISAHRDNEEGYVLFWPDKQLRVKAKLKNYVALHSIIAHLSELTVWECLRDGRSIDSLKEGLPDELYSWIDDVAQSLMDAASRRCMHVVAFADRIHQDGLQSSIREHRGRIAGIMKQELAQDLHSAAWLELDNKDSTAEIYKPLRPQPGSMGFNPMKFHEVSG